MDETSFEKKPKKKIGLIIASIVIILIVAVLVAGMVYMQLNKKPEKIFTKAIEKVFNMEDTKTTSERIKLGITANIEGNSMQAKQINAFLGMVKLNSTTEVDIEKEIFNQNIAVTMLTNKIDLDALIQGGKIYVYMEDLYNKYIQIDEEDLEGVDLSTIFKADTTSGEKIAKDIKQSLLNIVNEKEIAQEKVELNGEKVTKSTLKLTQKELLTILKSALEKYYETTLDEEIQNLIIDLEEEILYMEDAEIYAEISIYTKGLTSSVVKTEIALVNIEFDEVIGIEMNNKEENKTEIKILMNEDTASLKNAKEVLVIKIEETSENSGIIEIPIEIPETFEESEIKKVVIKIDYNIEKNAEIEKRNVSNSINANDLTDADLEIMYKNAENNAILSSIMQYILPVEQEVPEIDYSFDDDIFEDDDISVDWDF